MDLLKRFRDAGGLVAVTGEPCGYVDAVESGAMAEFAAACPGTAPEGAGLVRAVEGTCRRVSIVSSGGREIPHTLYLLREDNANVYLFVCNTGHDYRKSVVDVPVADRTAGFRNVMVRGFDGCLGAPLEFDAETGAVYRANASRKAGAWEVVTDLPPLGSRMFVAPKKREPVAGVARRPVLNEARRTTVAGRAWSVTLSDVNCVVLDAPQVCIDGGPWQAENEVLRVDGTIRDALGVDRRGGRMCQPWAVARSGNPRSIRVRLRYRFDVDELPSGVVFLAVEQPHRYDVLVNGAALSTDMSSGWWTDLSLRKVPLDGALLKRGANEIEFACDYDEHHPGLEIVYLLGVFGTRVTGQRVTMTSAPSTLRLGDWVGQGLAFYSGSVCYSKRVRASVGAGERLFVEVPKYRGAAVRVTIDGEAAGVIAWEPNEVEITRLVKRGKGFELGIEVVGHRRNSHGPLHHSEKNPQWTGPAEFVTQGDTWTDGYQFVPCGLMASPRLVVKKKARR